MMTMEFSIGPAFLVQGVLRGFFYVTLCIVLWTCLGPTLKKILNKIGKKQSSERDNGGISERMHAERQKLFREKIQQEHVVKATEYDEKYLKPKKEAKKAQQEKEYYRFLGPVPFAGQGRQLLEEDERSSELRRRGAGTSKDAATLRRLPENVTKPVVMVPKSTKKEKRVIELPAEPEKGTPNSITVAMRGLADRVRTRRFMTDEKVQVLLDWIEKQGYHSMLYTVCTRYPRQDLSQVVTQTLEETGLVKDVLLLIEEKEDVATDEERS